MKKILTLILTAAMLMSTFAFYTSAAGELVFSDNFDDGYKPRNWLLSGNKFNWDKENGCIVGYSDAVVVQSNYESPYNKSWEDFYTSVDFQIRADDDAGDWQEGNLTYAGLWYCDTFRSPTGDGASYMILVCVQTGEMHVKKDHTFSYKDDKGVTREHTISEIIAGPVKTSVDSLEIGEDAPFYNIGLRITDGIMQCYFEGELIIDLAANEDDEKLGNISLKGIDATVGTMNSPILLWNVKNYMAFDNFEVWTADYDFKDVVYGDADGSGAVNLGDVSAIMKSIAGWETEIDTSAADVDVNGSVNLLDVSLIMKHIAKWDVVLGK